MTDEAGDASILDEEPLHLNLYAPQTPAWLRPVRNRVTALPGGLIAWRVLVGVVGAAIFLLGLVLVPLPGPGWAIVFLGVAVWATEYRWAQRLLRWGRGVLVAWTAWTMRQSVPVKVLIALVGLAFIAAIGWFGVRLLS